MKLRLPIVVVALFLTILILPSFVSQVESTTNTYYPSNYNLLGSTQLVSGSLGDLQSDDGNYMTFRSYSNYDFRFAESLEESSWNANTEYQDKVVLTFTPPTSADYIVLATAEVQGDCISPPDVRARLYIGGSTYQELIYRIKDTTDWYPFCALKRIYLTASPQTLKIQYAISTTTLTAKIRNARLYAFSLNSEYAESEAESSWNTNTNWQDKVALTFTPSTSGDYLVIATANYGGSSTDYSTLLQFLKDGSVQAGPTRETGASEARYTFGVIRKINLNATSHTFKIQYRTENTVNTAYISHVHIVAIRVDQFSNNYYTESESESAPAAGYTWYTKVTNTYTAQAADHLIIGSILYKSGSTSRSVGVKLLQGAAVDQSLLVEHKDSTDYEGCFMMAKASLPAGSATDRIQYMGEGTSARVKNARLISLQLPTEHTVEVEFTGSSNTLDWTQLTWTVDSAWTTPSVTVTLQLYNYNLGQYPTSGDGYISYTSSATSNTDETKTQTITTNPTHFRDGSGDWKIKVKGVKSTTTQFDFKADLVKFEVTYTPPTVQYYLTVKTDPDGIVAISGEGWYNNCTYVDLTAPLFVPDEAGVGGERYRFDNWTVDGNFVSGNPISVYMDANHIAIAHYVKQYKLIMSTNFGTTSPSVGEHWYDAGSVVSISATAPSVVDGEQYVWLGWTGTGTISYTGMNNPSSVTMNSPITETAAWRHEYQLTMATNYGTTSPSVGDHWYEAGTTVPIQAFAPSVIEGEQYVWNGWTGTGTISYTGTANPSSVTMNSPISESASWTHQFLLTIKTSGLPSAYPTKVYLAGSEVGTASDSASYTQWFDAGTSTGTIGVDNTVSGAAGTQYVFVKWVEDSSTTNPRASETMNSPKTFTANYNTQYRLIVRSNGLGTYSTKVYNVTTVLGTATDSAPYTGWFNQGSLILLNMDTPIVDGSKRFVFTHWSGDISGTEPLPPVTMNTAKDITINYKTQYEITVTASPSEALGGDFRVTYTKCGTTYTDVIEITPWTEWVDAGTTVTVSDPMDLMGESPGMNFKFDHYDPLASVIMDQAKTITLVYKTQYLVSFTQTGSAIAPNVTYTADTDPTQAVPFDVWVKAGSQITYTYQDIVLGSGVRYVLTSVTPASPQTVNSPLTINGAYKTQYQITVTADPSGANGGTFKVTYTSCGTTFTNVVKTTSWTEWADADTSVTVSEPQDTIDISLGARYKFDYYTPSASVTMDQTKTITLVYKTQYQVSFTQTGSAVAPTVTYTADTDPTGTVPFTVWVKAGSQITYNYQSIVPGATGVRYVLTSVTPASPQTVNGPLTISGSYKTQYLLTVLTDPAGLSPQPTRDPAGEAGPANGWWYDASTGVTLTAQTVTGYTFNEWDVDGSFKGSEVNPITVSMNASKTATAHYTQITTYTLTIIVAQGGTTNPLPGSSTHAPGTQVSVTASPSSGYAFDHWELDGVNVGSANPYTVTMTKDYTLRAVFTQLARPVGGYSISLTKQTPVSHITVYALFIVLFGVVLTLTKRKRK